MKPEPKTLSFTGSEAANYDRYLGPYFFEDFAMDVSSRVSASAQRVLELCCGTGRVTNHLRKVLAPSCELIASDISEDMLAIGREKLKGQLISWRVIDAQQIPLEDCSCDQVVCCFGYMFVPDKERALAEAWRVLRPGGALLMTTWDKLENNGASNIFRIKVKEYFGDTLPESYKLPTSMHNSESIKQLLVAAGFSQVFIETVEKIPSGFSAKEVAYTLLHGGTIYNEIINRDPSWVQKIMDNVEKELSSKYGNNPMLAPLRALIGHAIK